MTRKRPKSSIRGGSGKGPADATRAEPQKDIPPRVGSAGISPKRIVLIAALLAAVTVVATGLGFRFLNRDGSTGGMPGVSVATLVLEA